jgi:hypothetical protein
MNIVYENHNILIHTIQDYYIVLFNNYNRPDDSVHIILDNSVLSKVQKFLINRGKLI